MRFTPTELPGAWIVDLEPVEDERGFFARSWCEREFADHGLASRFVQCGISFNRRRGTLRGLHYQAAPHAETKLVRCTCGAIFDVLVDLRPEAVHRRRWVGVELTAENRRMLFVPEGVAHGFLTLADASEVFYQISTPHEPASARGVRWNDPAFGIAWPEPVLVIAPRDAEFPDFRPA